MPKSTLTDERRLEILDSFIRKELIKVGPDAILLAFAKESWCNSFAYEESEGGALHELHQDGKVSDEELFELAKPHLAVLIGRVTNSKVTIEW